MAIPVTTVTSPNRGVKRTSKQVSNLGPADGVTSLILIDDHGILYEVSNLGAQKYKIKGDGRVWFASAPSNPSNPEDGDFWFDGSVYSYRAGGLTFVLGGSNGASAFSATTSANLVAGQPVIAVGGGVSPANAVTAYDIVGVSAGAYSASSVATILTDGAIVTAANWTALTGSAALTIGSNYLLTDAGGLALTMGTTIVVVGQAVTTTALKVGVRVIL